MEKGLKEVYEGVKKLITISERIEEHTKDIEEIREKVGVIENRLDSVDTELISLKVGQKEMSADIRTIKEKMELKDEIYAIKERLTLIEEAQQVRSKA
ncbi:MAG: hypothetical protein J7K81_04720 [Methanophagales archaeon]|nr:hypothetical protein [Methanophagales archaeon]